MAYTINEQRAALARALLAVPQLERRTLWVQAYEAVEESRLASSAFVRDARLATARAFARRLGIVA